MDRVTSCKNAIDLLVKEGLLSRSRFGLGVTFIGRTFESGDRIANSPVYNHSEFVCKNIVESIFRDKTFEKVRPFWLINPLTGRRMELDLYNSDLELAFEYNGKSHYDFNPRYHRSIDDFLRQGQRDYMKKCICKENGVDLIVIPSIRKTLHMRNYIINELRQNIKYSEYI